MPDYQLEHVSVDISMDEINQLKLEFHESTGQACSAFEILAANFWSIRTRTINFKVETEVRLLFFANYRQLLDPPFPKGFYGNCFFPITIAAPSELLTQASTIENGVDWGSTRLTMDEALRSARFQFLALSSSQLASWGRCHCPRKVSPFSSGLGFRRFFGLFLVVFRRYLGFELCSNDGFVDGMFFTQCNNDDEVLY
ncbi:hypothetical protein CRYUN_Cryun23aG0115200 [Craigia yunnanensis]